MNRWPHSPTHFKMEVGGYIITSATYSKVPLFRSEEKLDLLEAFVLEECIKQRWEIQQWAVFSNHYHLLLNCKELSSSASSLIRSINSKSAIALNRLDGQKGRKVWYQFWDTHITNEKSFLARQNYVRNNPVKHGLVKNAEDYKWCSARWFRENSTKAFYETICSIDVSRVNVWDEF